MTDELIEDIEAGGIRRVLIAFDRDEAGEKGAARPAERLMTMCLQYFRVIFRKNASKLTGRNESPLTSRNSTARA